MTDVMKSWRNFIKENEKMEFPYQIYCDMDGVLVDFAKGLLQATHQDTTNADKQKAVYKIMASGKDFNVFKNDPVLAKGLKHIYKVLNRNKEFWVSLPMKEDAQELWSFLAPFDPYVLSAPWDKDSADGKLIWVNEHLNPQPEKVFLTHDKFKYAYNKETNLPNILIDDMEKYYIPWENAGGIAIHHTSTKDTIKKLQQLIRGV